MKRSSSKRVDVSDNRAAGFTLVEVLATLMAGAILIGAVTVAVNAQAVLAQKHRDLVIVNAWANGRVESLRSKGFLGLSAGTTDITAELPTELKAPRSATLVISAESVSVWEADLSITYNEYGTPRTVSYTTLIGELGVGQY